MLEINDQNQIEIYNVVPVFRGKRIIKFLTSVSMSDVNKVYEKLIYDVNTQRGERIKYNRKRDVQSKEKIVNKMNIEEMKVKMLDEFFDGGNLCWNLRIKESADYDYKDVCEFYPLENKIVIKTDYITLPDSAQRHIAIYGLKDYHLSIDQDTYCFPLSVCLYTLSEEQGLFSEINGEGSKASKTRALFLNNSMKSKLLKEIIRDSSLNDNIETTVDTSYRKDKVVAYATLYASLFDRRMGAYKQLQEDEAEDFKRWIIRFYNELIDIRPELSKKNAQERLEIHKRSLVGGNPMWYIYANLAKELRDDTNWKRKLSRLNAEYKAGNWKGDIMSMDNPIWKGTICIQTKDGEWKLNNNRRSIEFAWSIFQKFLNLV